MSPKGLAERWHIPLQTVYKMNSEGRGPRYITVGKHCRYRESDVIAWENARFANGRPAA
jgi:predicted DNA-binding transcriptional regulator AlpA